jgi:hypothetical protein
MTTFNILPFNNYLEEFYRYKTNSELYFIRGFNKSIPTNLDDPTFIHGLTIFTGKNITASTTYIVEYETRFSQENNFLWPSTMGVYRFWL